MPDIRVLLISHTCQSRTEGQPKAALLSRMPGICLRVLVPDRWKHYGKWRAADRPAAEEFDCTIGRVAMPWVGPAQFYAHWYPGLGSIISEFKPDIIDLWEEPWGLISAQACYLRRRLAPGAKLLTETEQNIDKVLPYPFERWRAYTLRNADFAIGRNKDAIGVLRARGYRGPAEVVPNAVDADLFRPLDRESCRQELGFSGFVAGYIGRLVEEKGLMDLVEAVPHGPPQLKLLFVGAGDFKPTLEARVSALGIAHRVTFMAGRPLTELPGIMNAIDVLALPSRTTARWKEQFGRVIIEAHACGTPVLGSDSGAIPEVVGDAGMIVPERDPAAMGKALAVMAADPALCRRLGAEGRARVEQQFTWKTVAARMHSIYKLMMCESD